MRYGAGNGEMFDIQISEILTSTGLKVSKEGLVSDGVMTYGCLEGMKLHTPTRKVLDLGDSEALEYDPSGHRLIIESEDGKREVVDGGPPEGSVFVPSGPVFGTSDNGIEEIFMADMPLTTLDLDREFERLFPDVSDQLYYDELKEREMIDMAMLGHPELGVIPLSDTTVTMYHKYVQKRLRDCGYLGKRFPSNMVMDEVLTIRVGNNRRNPFREWVEAHEWDGQPRLRRVMIDYFGATAPALRQKDDIASADEIRYLETVTEAWFLGAVARMYGPTQHDIVPVLIGVQGGGKGTALRFLSGNDEWYAATTADVSNPERFLESVRGAIVVEMGEAKQIRGRGVQEDLKAFISQREDRIRKKYARYEETYPRHFILAATANNDSIFTDPTGARRFYPMYCRPAEATKEIPVRYRSKVHQYEVEQIWAEALYKYKEGAKPYVGKKVDELARVMQREAAVENPLSEMIEDWVNDPVNGYTALGSRVYREMILENVFEIDPRCPPANIDRAWADWVDSNRRWEKCKPFSAKGKTRRGFIRVMEPDTRVEIETLKLVDGDEERYSDESSEEPTEEVVEEPEEIEFSADGPMGVKVEEIIRALDGSDDLEDLDFGPAKPAEAPTQEPVDVPEEDGREDEVFEDERRLSVMSPEDRERVALGVYRKAVKTCKLTVNRIIPTYTMSQDVIDVLMELGYIYNTGTDTKPQYRVGDMP